eukprot:5151953-Amphidinium_carterae.1
MASFGRGGVSQTLRQRHSWSFLCALRNRLARQHSEPPPGLNYLSQPYQRAPSEPKRSPNNKAETFAPVGFPQGVRPGPLRPVSSLAGISHCCYRPTL